MTQFILASGSPRRKELLNQIGIQFRIEASHGEEIITKTEPSEIVKELSYQKAWEVYDRSCRENKEKTVVIGADTIVALNGEIMGKPKDKKDAERMLLALQNNTHQVYTGVTLIIKEKDKKEADVIQFFEKTDVYVYPMSEAEINQYITTPESLENAHYVWEGKAGGYGIQDIFGKKYVKGIDGDYYNVMGLPVSRLYQELRRAGIEI